MAKIDSRDKRPIYQQIIDRVILLISTGVLTAGEKMPSIRNLAQELGVNANTVARAYAELEHKGIIETVAKSGTFVKDTNVSQEVYSNAKQEIREFVNKYAQMGIARQELEALMQEALENVANN